MKLSEEKSADGSTADHSDSTCDAAADNWACVSTSEAPTGVGGAAAASRLCAPVGAVVVVMAGVVEPADGVVEAGVVVEEVGEGAGEPVLVEGVLVTGVVDEAGGAELLGGDGAPTVTVWPEEPLVVVVVLLPLEVVVVVVPLVVVVVGQLTDLAWITTPEPKWQLVEVVVGDVVGEGVGATGLGTIFVVATWRVVVTGTITVRVCGTTMRVVDVDLTIRRTVRWTTTRRMAVRAVGGVTGAAALDVLVVALEAGVDSVRAGTV